MAHRPAGGSERGLGGLFRARVQESLRLAATPLPADTPHRYLLTRRIERATALLRDTDLPITDIAFQTGWTSLGTFGRIFRDITGASPGELRAREQSLPQAGEQIPECVTRSAQRPDLNIAVLEKRRMKANGKL